MMYVRMYSIKFRDSFKSGMKNTVYNSPSPTEQSSSASCGRLSTLRLLRLGLTGVEASSDRVNCSGDFIVESSDALLSGHWLNDDCCGCGMTREREIDLRRDRKRDVLVWRAGPAERKRRGKEGLEVLPSESGMNGWREAPFEWVREARVENQGLQDQGLDGRRLQSGGGAGMPCLTGRRFPSPAIVRHTYPAILRSDQIIALVSRRRRRLAFESCCRRERRRPEELNDRAIPASWSKTDRFLKPASISAAALRFKV